MCVCANAQSQQVVEAGAVHAGCGFWGTIACGLFHPTKGFRYTGRVSFLLIQIFGSVVIFCLAFFCTLTVAFILRKAEYLRVSAEEEEKGLDHKFGLAASAYHLERAQRIRETASIIRNAGGSVTDLIEALQGLKYRILLPFNPQASDLVIEGQVIDVLSRFDINFAEKEPDELDKFGEKAGGVTLELHSDDSIRAGRRHAGISYEHPFDHDESVRAGRRHAPRLHNDDGPMDDSIKQGRRHAPGTVPGADNGFPKPVQGQGPSPPASPPPSSPLPPPHSRPVVDATAGDNVGDSPAQGGNTPAKEGHTPAAKQFAPQENGDTPANEGGSPANEGESSAKETWSPSEASFKSLVVPALQPELHPSLARPKADQAKTDPSPAADRPKGSKARRMSNALTGRRLSIGFKPQPEIGGRTSKAGNSESEGDGTRISTDASGKAIRIKSPTKVVEPAEPPAPAAVIPAAVLPSAQPLADEDQKATPIKWLAFVSHHKQDCGEAARVFVDTARRVFGSIGDDDDGIDSELIFLDSNNLSDLRQLLDHIDQSANFILMLTRQSLERPWVLAELITAHNSGKPILVVATQWPGDDTSAQGRSFKFPQHLDEAIDEWQEYYFESRMREKFIEAAEEQDSWLGKLIASSVFLTLLKEFIQRIAQCLIDSCQGGTERPTNASSWVRDRWTIITEKMAPIAREIAPIAPKVPTTFSSTAEEVGERMTSVLTTFNNQPKWQPLTDDDPSMHEA